MRNNPLKNHKFARQCLAEVFGTFCLIFAGTGAVIVNDTFGSVTHVGVALTWGLVVTGMIYGLGELSGAHLNPAVTLGFWIARRFPMKFVPGYITAQLTGAILASFLLKLLFPEHEGLGGTLPAGKVSQSFVFEFILTWMLMLVILGVSSGAKEKGVLAGIAVGGVIALEAMFAGPVCGASMNPARSIAPALASGNWQHQWLYVLAPISGAAFAVICCMLIHDCGSGCCEEAPCENGGD